MALGIPKITHEIKIHKRRMRINRAVERRRRNDDWLLNHAEEILGLRVACECGGEQRVGIINSVGFTPYLDEPSTTVRFYVCAPPDAPHQFGGYFLSRDLVME